MNDKNKPVGERAAEALDNAADTVADKAEDAGDRVADATDRAGRKVKNAAHDTADKVEDATDSVRDSVGDAADRATRKANRAADKVDDVADSVQGAVGDATDQFSTGLRQGHGVINRLHRMGLRSEYAYIGGFLSIGISVATWAASRKAEGDSKAQSDRWGIFVGHWAPTFFALGVALKLEEDD